MEDIDFPSVAIEPGSQRKPKVSSPFKCDSPSLRWMSHNAEMRTMAQHEERIRNM